MIEQGIYFALGCIVTALAALMFAPAFWSRALRLTRQRLQLQVPLSMQEIFAERDQLRAEFAVERLRVEQDLERTQAGKADDMAEIGRYSVKAARFAEELAAARIDVADRDAEIGRRTAEESRLSDELSTARRDIAERDREIALRLTEESRLSAELATAGRDIAERDTELDLRGSEANRLADALSAAQFKLAERDTEIGRRGLEANRLTDELSAARRDGAKRDGELALRATEASRLEGDLAAARSKHVAHEAEIGQRAVEVNGLTDELSAARSQHAEHGAEARRELAERATEIVGLQTELRHARQLIDDLTRPSEPAADATRPDVVEGAPVPERTADPVQPHETMRALQDELAAAQAALVAAKEREKSLHLQSSLSAGKSRAADRSAGGRIEVLQAENTALQSALEAARREATSPSGATDDSGLRDSIHALGVAVAAMTRDAGQQTPEEAKSSGEVQTAF